MAWPSEVSQQFSIWSGQSAQPADTSNLDAAGDADIADMAAEMANIAPSVAGPQQIGGGSPVILQPGDIGVEALQAGAPQGFHLQGAFLQQPHWASHGGLAAATGSWLGTAPAQQAKQEVPPSRDCGGSFANARSRLSQDCAPESPHAAPQGFQQLLPPATSHPDLATAAMPPPAVPRRAYSMPPRSPVAGGSTPAKVGAPKGGGGRPARSSKAAKGSKPAGSPRIGDGGGGTKGGGVGKAGGSASGSGGSKPGGRLGGGGGGGSGRRTGRRLWRHTTLEGLREAQHQFAVARGWEKFHTPRSLVMALTGEVGELNEIFQWRGEVPPGLPGFTPADREHVGEEIADVLLYLLRLADVCGLDLGACAHQKMAKNGEKYRPEQCFGSSAKYTSYSAAAAAADRDKHTAAAAPAAHAEAAAVPVAGRTGRRSPRRPAAGPASKRRSSAPASRQRPPPPPPATPLQGPLPPQPPPAWLGAALPMDLIESGPTQESGPAGGPGAVPAAAAGPLTPPGQQLLSLAAAGRQPTPPVTPAAMESLGPARSPIPGVPAFGGGGGGGSLIPGVDHGADWPPGASWSTLPSLRTAGDGSAGAAFADDQVGDCKGITFGGSGGAGVPGLPPSGSSAPPGFGYCGSAGWQRQLPPTPQSARAAAMPRGCSAPAGEPEVKPITPAVAQRGAQHADGTTETVFPSAAAGLPAAGPPASAPASPLSHGSLSGSKALTAANIEWLRHADPVELLLRGLGD